jgi:hypothetical protein
MDKEMLSTLRAMAWARAKGELESMLSTFYPEWYENNNHVPNGYDELKTAIDDFISLVENTIGIDG